MELLQNMDAKLATAWQIFRQFCILINIGGQAQRFMSKEMIHETMTTVMYRLLRMNFAPNSTNVTIRL